MTHSQRMQGGIAAASVLLFVALALAYPAGGIVTEVDAEVARWVAASMPTWAESIARSFTWLGGGLVLPLLTLAVAGVLWRRGERVDAVFVVAVLAFVNLLVWLLKLGFDRPRPDAGSAIPLPHSPSFPSGHAANGVAVLGALGIVAAAHTASTRLRVVSIAGGLALGAAVGASRVVLGVHFVSDVLAGYCVGLAVLCCALLVRDAAASSGSAATIAR